MLRISFFIVIESTRHSLFFIILTIINTFILGVKTSPSPEDLAVSSPFQIDGNAGDTFTSAFINVSREDENGWKWDKAQVGRYGGGYIGPAFGVIVHVTHETEIDNHYGCKLPFRRPNRQSLPATEPWIALIKRGKCNFEDKVSNAFQSKAAGVIVYNDRDSTELEKMKLSSVNGRNISAIFTYKWKGEELARLSENNSRVLVHITIAGHSSRSATINRTSVLFVSITFIVLMIISLAWLVFYYVQRFRYIHAKDRLSKRLCNAAKKALSKIPTKNIKIGDKELQGDGECCAICIEPYRIPEIIRILPCSHEFHKSCIDPWLLEHRTCPMCKMDILKHYGFVFSGSQVSFLHMEPEEIVALGINNEASPRRNASGGGISPLPQIRPLNEQELQIILGNMDELDSHSSRSASPNEMTPSLPNRLIPVRQDLCVSCIAAATTTTSTTATSTNLVSNNDTTAMKQQQQQEQTTSNNAACEISSNCSNNSDTTPCSNDLQIS